MEVINYFKVRSIIEVSITQVLREIFVQRFNKERFLNNSHNNNNKNNYSYNSFSKIKEISSSIDWNNSTDNINFILNNYPTERYSSFSSIEKEIISNGKIESFSFNIIINLLLYFRYVVVDRETIRNLNEIINIVKYIYYDKVYNNREFKITDTKTISILNEIYEKLKSFVSDSINELIKSFNSIKQDQSTSEELVEKMMKRGDGLSKDNKFEMAFLEYSCGLNYINISNTLKSLVYLNCGISLFDLAKQSSSGFLEGKIGADYREYDLIMKSREMLINSILYKPDRCKAYFRLGIVLSKISEYQVAIEILESAKLLNTKYLNTPIIEKFINETKSKFAIIQNSIKRSDNSRNFEKETLTILNESILNKFINSSFKEKLTSEYIESLFSKLNEKEKKELVQNPGENLTKKIMELNICLQVLVHHDHFQKGYSDIGNKVLNLTLQDCYEIFERLLASDSGFTRPYYELLKYFAEKSDRKKDDIKLILAIIMKISTMPIPFYYDKSLTIRQQYICANYDVINMQEMLGTIYKTGALNQDIDLQKSKYYYQLSIKNCRESTIPNELKSQFGSTSNAYYSLGVLAFIKPLSNILGDSDYYIRNLNLIDINKLCLYWKLGSNIINSQFSAACLEKYNFYMNNNSIYKKEDINSSTNTIARFSNIKIQKNKEYDQNKSTSPFSELSREKVFIGQALKDELLNCQSVGKPPKEQFGDENIELKRKVESKEALEYEKKLLNNENYSSETLDVVTFENQTWKYKECSEINKTQVGSFINKEIINERIRSENFNPYQDFNDIENKKNEFELTKNLDLKLYSGNNVLGLFIFKEFNQEINQDGIKMLYENEDTSNEYVKSLYEMNLKVADFITSFKKFKEFEEQGIEFLLSDKIELISQLSNQYCNLEISSSIRIQEPMKEQLVDFLDKLILQASNVKCVRLAYVALNLFNKSKYDHLIEILNLSCPNVLEFPSQLYLKSFSSKYTQAFSFYSVLLHILNNQLYLAFKKSINYEFEFYNCSYVFNYLIFNLLIEFGPQDATLSPTAFQNICENGQDYAENSLLFGNPLKNHYFNLIAISLFKHIQIDPINQEIYSDKLNQILLLVNQFHNNNQIFYNNFQKERYEISQLIFNNLKK